MISAGYIYILHDPTHISLTCYVGQTTDIKDRYYKHLHTYNKRYVSVWIKSLLKRNVEPEIIVLEEIHSNDLSELKLKLDEAEIFYIEYFKAIGLKLSNLTKGGGGMLGFKLTPESIEKMRLKKLGLEVPIETRLKKSKQDIVNNIQYISSLYNDGYSLTELGKMFNAHHQTIRKHLLYNGIELRNGFSERSKQKMSQSGRRRVILMKQK